MKPDQLKNWIGQWKIQCTILPIPEGQCTYRKGSTVIDYILCYQGSNLTCSNATIYEWRDEPLSDHNALCATLMINKEPWKSKSKKKRIGCIPKELGKLLEKCRRIRREKAQRVVKSPEEQVKDKETLMEGNRALRQIMKEKELRDLRYGLDNY